MILLVGPLANALELALGGVLGVLLKSRISQRLSDFLMEGQGLVVLLLGIQGVMRGGTVVVVATSMALGSALGLAIDIDAAVTRFGDWAQGRLAGLTRGNERLGHFSEGFVTATLFACVGSMAIVGSLSAGLEGDPSTLVAKGLIDLVCAMVMAASMGVGVPFAGATVLVYELVLTACAGLLAPVLSDAVVTEMVVTGSLLLLAMGLNMLGVTRIKIANLLPSCFVPMLLVPLAQLAGLM